MTGSTKVSALFQHREPESRVDIKTFIFFEYDSKVKQNVSVPIISACDWLLRITSAIIQIKYNNACTFGNKGFMMATV